MLPLGICAVARDERAKKEIARKDKNAKSFLGNTTTSSLWKISGIRCGAGGVGWQGLLVELRDGGGSSRDRLLDIDGSAEAEH
jgi:hypothetical protein